jgi:hypothetical protein
MIALGSEPYTNYYCRTNKVQRQAFRWIAIGGSMSNYSLVARMHGILTDYEQGRLRPMDVERQVETRMEGLECIGSSELHLSRDLTARLVIADALIGEEGFGEPQDVREVLKDFRHFLNELPRH